MLCCNSGCNRACHLLSPTQKRQRGCVHFRSVTLVESLGEVLSCGIKYHRLVLWMFVLRSYRGGPAGLACMNAPGEFRERNRS